MEMKKKNKKKKMKNKKKKKKNLKEKVEENKRDKLKYKNLIMDTNQMLVKKLKPI
jgi:hypothetical protein